MFYSLIIYLFIYLEYTSDSQSIQKLKIQYINKNNDRNITNIKIKIMIKYVNYKKYTYNNLHNEVEIDIKLKANIIKCTANL